MAPSLTLISLESTQGRVVEHYSQYHILVTIFAIQNSMFLKILAGFFFEILKHKIFSGRYERHFRTHAYINRKIFMGNEFDL